MTGDEAEKNGLGPEILYSEKLEQWETTQVFQKRELIKCPDRGLSGCLCGGW